MVAEEIPLASFVHPVHTEGECVIVHVKDDLESRKSGMTERDTDDGGDGNYGGCDKDIESTTIPSTYNTIRQLRTFEDIHLLKIRLLT